MNRWRSIGSGVSLAVGLLGGVSGCAAAGNGSGGGRLSPAVAPALGDPIDDRGLQALASDANARPGAAGVLARARLVAAQTRAFVVAAVRAMHPPPGVQARPEQADGGSAPDASPVPSTFSPPATLVQQLGNSPACRAGGEAHGCAGAVATALIAAIHALPQDAGQRDTRDGLLATLAALHEERVELSAATRWRVLQSGTDVAARTAQAVTLAIATREIALAAGAACPCREASQMAATLSDSLGIGACSDGFEHATAEAAHERSGHRALRALASAACSPECTRTALAGNGDDPLLEAARTCRSNDASVHWAPFADAAAAVSAWMRAVTPALEELQTDPAVAALLRERVDISSAELPTAPPYFFTRGNLAIDLPSVRDDGVAGLEMRGARGLVWVPREGDAWLQATDWLAMRESTLAPTRAVSLQSAASEGSSASDADHPGRGPVAFAFARDVAAARVLDALRPVGARASSAPFGLAVRHGWSTWYAPLRAVTEATGTVLRIAATSITVIAPGQPARVVALGPSEHAADLLGGAIPDAAPTGPVTIALEEGATVDALARAATALGVHLARGETQPPPGLLLQLARGAVVSNVADAATGQRLAEALEPQRAALQQCLSTLPGAHPASPQPAVVHIVLDASGRPTTTELLPGPVALTRVLPCVRRALQNAHLPAAAADIRIDVSR